MGKYYFKRLFLLCTFCVFCIATKAQKPIIFGGNFMDNFIGLYVETFQDTTNKLNVNEVNKLEHAFKPNTNDVPNFGISRYNNWIRFKVVNHSAKDFLLLNISYPQIDIVHAFEDTLTDQQDPQHPLFVSLPKAFVHQFFIFKLNVKRGDTSVCYIMLRSNKQLVVPIRLTNSKDMVHFITSTDAFSGLYVGFMLVMIFYNLFIFFSSRDKQYIYYVNYVLWVALAQTCLLGYTGRFIWTEPGWFQRNMLSFFGAMSGIASVMFVQVFLQTKKHTPVLHRILGVIIGIDIFAILALFAGYPRFSYQLFNSIAGIGAIIIFIAGILIIPKSKKQASYFLIAWSIFLISVIIFVLKDYNLIRYNFFSVHSVQLGSGLEAVLLSFALADQINTMKKEKDQSRLEALRIAKENSQIIRKQNALLEIKVSERTEELQIKNETLNVTLSNLKDAQIQLVESEKMASLGQLTAGIAHEINNPINFVTGNIRPLKRDVSVLFDTINLLESFLNNDLTEEEKVTNLRKFKAEQDFDYLKVEINHLLNGIHEGAARTAEIVKSLRIFSRLDEDDQKLADLNEGIDSTLTIINNLLNKIEVHKHYEKLPLINCYPGKLNQVFLNIISNGIDAIKSKFGEDEGGILTVSTQIRDKHLIIKLEDNGSGMNEETKKKIFDPFFTTKDVGQGTGLGMSIVFNTIQKHNGTIQVISELGIGTKFEICIPIVD